MSNFGPSFVTLTLGASESCPSFPTFTPYVSNSTTIPPYAYPSFFTFTLAVKTHSKEPQPLLYISLACPSFAK